MLSLTILGDELYDEELNEFSTVGDFTLELEHSLISLSKWESKFEKAFLGKEEKTGEEIFEYVKMMVITPDFPPEVFQKLTSENFEEVRQYIESKQSATTFRETPNGKINNEIVTAEVIYHWMVAHRIPLEAETWHLNKLFSLIRICNIKNSPPKKRSMKDIAAENRALNEARRQKLGTSG